jgi:3-methyladenine DNA glycosylase Tag
MRDSKLEALLLDPDIYVFMQAVGMVDDHIADCWKRTES